MSDIREQLSVRRQLADGEWRRPFRRYMRSQRSALIRKSCALRWGAYASFSAFDKILHSCAASRPTTSLWILKACISGESSWRPSPRRDARARGGAAAGGKNCLFLKMSFCENIYFFKSFNKKFNDFYLKTIKSLKIYKTKPEVNNKISKN